MLRKLFINRRVEERKEVIRRARMVQVQGFCSWLGSSTYSCAFRTVKKRTRGMYQFYLAAGLLLALTGCRDRDLYVWLGSCSEVLA